MNSVRFHSSHMSIPFQLISLTILFITLYTPSFSLIIALLSLILSLPLCHFCRHPSFAYVKKYFWINNFHLYWHQLYFWKKYMNRRILRNKNFHVLSYIQYQSLGSILAIIIYICLYTTNTNYWWGRCQFYSASLCLWWRCQVLQSGTECSTLTNQNRIYLRTFLWKLILFWQTFYLKDGLYWSIST